MSSLRAQALILGTGAVARSSAQPGRNGHGTEVGVVERDRAFAKNPPRRSLPSVQRSACHGESVALVRKVHLGGAVRLVTALRTGSGSEVRRHAPLPWRRRGRPAEDASDGGGTGSLRWP